MRTFSRKQAFPPTPTPSPPTPTIPPIHTSTHLLTQTNPHTNAFSPRPSAASISPPAPPTNHAPFPHAQDTAHTPRLLSPRPRRRPQHAFSPHAHSPAHARPSPRVPAVANARGRRAEKCHLGSFLK
ncbi:extensin-like [Penaeus chinensis]|uniref:extensin-like n=1 Tax=Penaeus chinensis TaxID=139456 RepID=UPI001FB57044|nr:extensin-like [Penaeus chinensis]